MNIFENASRIKCRFDSPQGTLCVEDLWDLPLQTSRVGKASLDNIAINLDKQIKDSGTVSFVDAAPAGNNELNLKFEIVKHIIEVRKAENLAAETRRTNAEKKQRILALIGQKEDEALASKSVDELRELVNGI